MRIRRWRICRRVIYCVISLAWLLPGCSDPECRGRARIECREGTTYWIDSCGNLQEVEEVCQCGCEDDASACRRCNCTCDEENLCCDGCLPVHQGMACNDNDPDTVSERCRGGECTGWRISEIAGPAPPAEPAAPEPVRLRSWQCPAGWLATAHAEELDENGDPFSWCEPPPLPRLSVGGYITPLKDGEIDGDRPVCEPLVDGTYPLLGHADCRPLGDACPAGDWPDVPGNPVYVLAGAAGGDGSQAAPFGTISEAVAAAAPGDVVVIGAGTYSESVSIASDISLWGKCVGEVLIQAPGPYSGGGAIEVTGGAVVDVRNLRITGEQNGVLINAPDVQVRLQGVWIHEATSRGVVIADGGVTLTGVLITSTRMNPSGGGGVGVSAWGEAAWIRVESSTVENNPAAGIVAGSDTPENGSATVEMADVTVRETCGRPGDSTWGMGCYFTGAAQATGSRILLDHNRLDGILAYDQGTLVDFSDLVVLDTVPVDGDAVTGMGVEAVYARLHLTRALIRGSHIVGAYFYREGTAGELQDLVITDSKGSPQGGMFGRGLGVETGAFVRMQRGLLERNREEGVLIEGEGTRVELFDLVVRDTQSWERSPPILGRGLNVQAAASVLLERGRFEKNRDLGIAVIQAGTVLDMTDVTVLDTRSQETDGLFGRGLYIKDGAQVSLLRGWFEGNREAAVAMDGYNTVVSIEDLTVRDTLPQEATLALGRGMTVEMRARLTLKRALLDNNREMGILVASTGTTADLEDLTVKNTQSQLRDLRTSERDLFFGRGLEVNTGARVTLKRGWFEKNREAGILTAGDGTYAELQDVVVQETVSREADQGFGFAVVAIVGSWLKIDRARLERNRAVSVSVANASKLELRDVVIRETLGQESDLLGGVALEAADGSEVVLENGWLSQNRELGVGAFGADTSITLLRVSVQDTLERACVSLADERNCADNGAGIGLGAYDGASISVEDVESVRSALVGVQLARLGALEGQGLSIRENPIGVNLQDTPVGYDFFGRVDDLWMSENEVNFDSRYLGVPLAMDVLEQ